MRTGASPTKTFDSATNARIRVSVDDHTNGLANANVASLGFPEIGRDPHVSGSDDIERRYV